jgi:4-diphosphocytidyl-2-C-methyl-D-erythritol kinase
MRLVLKANAKVNLDLRVLERRADGYHDLRTIFQAIALHDTIVIESTPRRPFSLAGDASLMPLGEENLAWKAAAVLWRAIGRSGVPTGARVTIRKRIPAQAGLGGGSSDAAATLLGLHRVWRAPLVATELASLAATLGADVPFFLVGGTALGLGRGDDVFPLIDVAVREVVIVRPAFGVATTDAYAWLAEARSRSAQRAAGRSGGLVNDFEAVVEARHPEIRRIRERLRELGATVTRLSGSGSAVFGLFDTAARARRAAAEIGRPDWTVVHTRTALRTPKQREFAKTLAREILHGGDAHLSGRRQIP